MGGFFNPNEANAEQIAAQGQPPARPESFDRYANTPDRQPGAPYSQIVDRAQAQLIGADGQKEAQGPIMHVNNFDASGRPTGTSEYDYTAAPDSGAKLNGYVDRDPQGHIREFAVRKPSAFPDQKDVFTVYRASPDHPIDEASMRRVMELLRPDVTPEQRLQNQKELNVERPLPYNLLDNRGQQILAVKLDPQTGQRFTVRDMRFDPNTGALIKDPRTGKPMDHANPVLCWAAPDGSTYRYNVSNMSDADKADLTNSKLHGNLRIPLELVNQGGAPQQRPRPVYRPVQQPQRMGQPGPGPMPDQGPDPNQDVPLKR